MSKPITLKIITDAKGVDKGIKHVEASFGGLKSTALKMGAAIGGAFAAKKVLDFGASAVRAAVEDEQSQAELARALRQTAGARAEDIASVENWISAQGRALGVTDDQLRPALATLTRMTGSMSKAQELATQAMDVSAATGKPLETVTKALARAYNGNVGALNRLGIETKNADGSTKSFKEIQEELNKKMGGAAKTAANTAGGKFNRFKVQMDELKESVGQNLLPVITTLAGFLTEKLVPAVESVVSFLEDNKTTILALTAVIAPFAAALGTILIIQKVSEALAAAKAAVVAFNLALAANPVLLIVAGIAALIAALILAYKKVGWFRAFVDASFKLIKGAISFVVDWVKNNWPLLLAILTGPIGVAVLLIQKNWDKIKEGFGKVKDFIGDRVEDVKGFFTGIPGAIETAFKTLADIVSAPFKAGFDLIKNAWNATLGGKGFSFHVPDFPGIPHRGENFEFRIPELASGALVKASPGGTIARLGEGGEDEFVIPRSKMGSGGGNVYVTVQGSLIGMSKKDLAKAINEEIRHSTSRGATR